MWPFIIIGLTTGSIYGLAGIGLVLTYKTSGIFNFAHGAIAAIGAYSYYAMVTSDVPKYLAAALVVFVVGPILGLLYEPLARKLRPQPLAMQVAATVGIVLIVEAGAIIKYGSSALTFPGILPSRLYAIGSVNVNLNQLVVVGLAFLVTVIMYVYFHKARTGIAMRAVVDDVEAFSNLSGTPSPSTVKRVAWSDRMRVCDRSQDCFSLRL